MVTVKSLFFTLLAVAGLCVSLVQAQGIQGGKVSDARVFSTEREQDSSMGIQSVRAVQVGLAVGSQKVAWDSYGLYGCNGGCTKDYASCSRCNCGQCNCCRSRASIINRYRSRLCLCNPCRCYPVCRCGQNSRR